MRIQPILLPLILVLFSCQQDSASAYQPKSLLEYGVPVTVMAPDSVEVEKEDWIVQQSISLRNEKEGYFVQIWMRQAPTADISALKAEKMAAVKQEDGFSRIVQDDPDGFIFERAVDTATVNFDFRYIQVKGDMEYTYQTDLTTELFSLEDVERMYQAVKEVKK